MSDGSRQLSGRVEGPGQLQVRVGQGSSGSPDLKSDLPPSLSRKTRPDNASLDVFLPKRSRFSIPSLRACSAKTPISLPRPKPKGFLIVDKLPAPIRVLKGIGEDLCNMNQ